MAQGNFVFTSIVERLLCTGLVRAVSVAMMLAVMRSGGEKVSLNNVFPSVRGQNQCAVTQGEKASAVNKQS